MLAYMLETMNDVDILVDICKRYKEKYDMDTNVIFKSYNISGCSYLGIASLLGNIVTVQPVKEVDSDVYKTFADNIMRVSKCY